MATQVAHIREATLGLNLGSPAIDPLYRPLKRALDLLLALILLVVLAPVLLLIACAIAIESPGPVLFRQKRVLGDQSVHQPRPDELVFEMLKFRTMRHNADQTVHQRYMEDLINGVAKSRSASGGKLYKLGGDARVTRVGAVLRRTSLDELPQLVNIVRGEMSFVGPRPAIPYEVRAYKPWHYHRLTVTQGLTGLWQVNGRNRLTFDEMVQYDIEYAQRRSLGMDALVLLATVPAVLTRRGAR